MPMITCSDCGKVHHSDNATCTAVERRLSDVHGIVRADVWGIEKTPRRALIGNLALLDGQVWKITGIATTGTARLAKNGTYRDIPQDQITWNGRQYVVEYPTT